MLGRKPPVVLLAQGIVTDSAHQKSLAVAPLSFMRVTDPLLTSTSFKMVLPPALAHAP